MFWKDWDNWKRYNGTLFPAFLKNVKWYAMRKKTANHTRLATTIIHTLRKQPQAENHTAQTEQSEYQTNVAPARANMFNSIQLQVYSG